jgi:hypothetical protein
MINYKDKDKITADNILAFLNYKREINANMIKYNGPMLDRNTLERMKLVFNIYNDLYKTVSNSRLFQAAIKEMKHYKHYKDDKEKREQKIGGESIEKQSEQSAISRRFYTNSERE